MRKIIHYTIFALFITSITSCGTSKKKCEAYGSININIEIENDLAQKTD